MLGLGKPGQGWQGRGPAAQNDRRPSNGNEQVVLDPKTPRRVSGEPRLLPENLDWAVEPEDIEICKVFLANAMKYRGGHVLAPRARSPPLTPWQHADMPAPCPMHSAPVSLSPG